MIFTKHIKLFILLWVVLAPLCLCASVKEEMQKSVDDINGGKEEKEYSLEVGAQVGTGYYIGDANKIPFVQSRYVFGAQFRYKIDKRWAVQLKVQHQNIAFNHDASVVLNPVWHADVVGEFNFFKFGFASYDYRVKTFSPYLYLGVGMTTFSDTIPKDNMSKSMFSMDTMAVYLPIGIGFKWRFAERWQLQVAWQHQVYFADNLEGLGGELDNVNDLNGWNILNNDLTSSLTIGVVFEFGEYRYKTYTNSASSVSARIRTGQMKYVE